MVLNTETRPARLSGELNSRPRHHSLGHASRASKCLLGGIKMSFSKHCRFDKLFLLRENILVDKIFKMEGFRALHLQ